MTLSPAQRMTAEEIAALTPKQLHDLRYLWREFWARPEQVAPEGDWRTWLFLAGRGTGKTRAGAEWVRERVANGSRRVALVARTGADVRDVLIEGESGILAIAPPDERPRWEPSRRRLTWPNGAIATTYSADEPDQLRGPQHDAAWADELAAWRFPDAWDQLLLGLRLGSDPRVMVTTTPRPTPIIRGLLKEPSTAVTRGRTRDNAGNLADAYLAAVVSRYEGTRLGRQELDGEVLDDAPGALWRLSQIDAARVAPDVSRRFRVIVVAVDPSVKDHSPGAQGDTGDACGIVVVGLGYDSHAYVLEDASGVMGPSAWAAAVVDAYDRWHANVVVAETNNGGALVTHTLHSARKGLPVVTVNAKRGKALRAEPVSLLAEQGRVHHVGAFPELEDELTTWEAGSPDSPDRLDALVYGVTHILHQVQAAAAIEADKAAPKLPVEDQIWQAHAKALAERESRSRMLRGSVRRR